MEQNTTSTTPPMKDGKGLGTAGLVVGIVAVFFSFVPCLGMWAIVPAVVGIVLSAMSISQAGKANAPKGMAIAGLICSIVAVLIAVYWIYVAYYVVNQAPEAIKEIQEELEKSGAMDSLNKAMEQLKNITDTLQNH